ncbi:MAG: UbiD family decarboxylase [Armatimonadetes bacterium]|nr:UbiD family decarboxylase [Armatimonadota bacterium]
MDLPLEELRDIAQPFQRRLALAAVLQEALREMGESSAVVGGHAVEAYTLGGYSTADIDLVVFAKSKAATVLTAWGFKQRGRVFWHETIGVAVDLIGQDLAGDWARTVAVEVGGHLARIIGPEDLIIDRLNACVHWQSPEHCHWAEAIAARRRADLDITYLQQRAVEEGVSEACQRVLEGVDRAHDQP